MNPSAGLLYRLLLRLASPSWMLALVWLGVLAIAAMGPIAYPGQPSQILLAVVMGGLLLFGFGDFGGRLLSRYWPSHEAPHAVSASALRTGVTVSAILGLSGIALILFERSFLSGLNNSNYAGLLRCAPDLVGEISVVRTPLIYIGYLTFSFGFASIALFLLRGEELSGWSAALAQLSILSPIGYALTYSGRMSILIIIVLTLSIGIVRLRQGRTFLPRGHYLLIKLGVGVMVFIAYTNSTWASRREFCEKLTPLISELRVEIYRKATSRVEESNAQLAAFASAKLAIERDIAETESNLKKKSRVLEAERQATGSEPFSDRVTSLQADVAQLELKLSELRRQLEEVTAEASDFTIKAASEGDMRNRSGTIDPSVLGAKMSEILRQGSGENAKTLTPMDAQILVMEEAWKVRPSQLLLAAVNNGYVSPSSAFSLIHNSFYFTQSAMIIDRIWRSRREFSGHLGVYQIGVLSPLIRKFLPDSTALVGMKTELLEADIYGFFPGVWGAAIVDFGVVGGAIYILIWGLVAGWSLGASLRSNWATPPLLLTFVLTSIALSPIQGPLGLANSALLLASLFVLGLVVDIGAVRRLKLWRLRGSRAVP